MTWTLGNGPEDPCALSTSAVNNSMAQQDCAKSLVSQLTSLDAFHRERGAFQRMEKSASQNLIVTFQNNLPISVCWARWEWEEGDMMDLSCSAHHHHGPTAFLMLKSGSTSPILSKQSSHHPYEGTFIPPSLHMKYGAKKPQNPQVKP